MKKRTAFVKQLLILNYSLLILTSCSVTKQIAQSAKEDVLDAKALQTAHVGISIFDPSTNKYLYNYQGDKYFVPASNTKLPTCYAAMKYLGDSLVSFLIKETEEEIRVKACGDPSFLNDEFTSQPILQYLKASDKKIVFEYNLKDKIEKYGSGWSWNDYEDYYMAERTAMPVYGNIISFEIKEKK
ncbi:MAG: D-alanyl-D-alanine carboxypeptidase [Chitinophagaceae bacterium]|nr:D-alanyl-D-alanine carboxypeptidase [Chitinophagaceae bacterium]